MAAHRCRRACRSDYRSFWFRTDYERSKCLSLKRFGGKIAADLECCWVYDVDSTLYSLHSDSAMQIVQNKSEHLKKSQVSKRPFELDHQNKRRQHRVSHSLHWKPSNFVTEHCSVSNRKIVRIILAANSRLDLRRVIRCNGSSPKARRELFKQTEQQSEHLIWSRLCSKKFRVQHLRFMTWTHFSMEAFWSRSEPRESSLAATRLPSRHWAFGLQTSKLSIALASKIILSKSFQASSSRIRSSWPARNASQCPWMLNAQRSFFSKPKASYLTESTP